MKHSNLILVAATFAATPLLWGEAHGQTAIDVCQDIDEAGSYVVTANLVSPQFDVCLDVTVSGVIIDLNGFEIDGTGTVGSSGVHAGGIENVTVRNGTVRNFGDGGAGVNIGGRGIVEGVHAIDNGVGIAAGGGSILTGNIAGSNEFSGIAVGAGSTVTRNVAANNGGDGFFVTGGPGNVLSYNVARLNDGDGFEVVCPSVLIGNASTDNADLDLNLDEDSFGEKCTAADNVPDK